MARSPSIIEKVTRARADDALREAHRHYPEATVTTEIGEGRGIITVLQDRYVLSKEFVESDESLRSTHRMIEYGRILMGKARLVVIVPQEHAVEARMCLLEFNNWWLFYYQVFFYDQTGQIKRMDREAWCKMSGRPYEGAPRAPEIA